jgi:hypothetical protein
LGRKKGNGRELWGREDKKEQQMCQREEKKEDKIGRKEKRKVIKRRKGRKEGNGKGVNGRKERERKKSERKMEKGTGKVPREEKKTNKNKEEKRKEGRKEGRNRTRRKVSLTICPVVLVTTASTGSMERGRFTASTGKLIVSSVADPDPLDPHVFGPPGSGSISQRYGCGSGYFYYKEKIVRKTLFSTVLLRLFDFLSLKNDGNVPSKSNM